MSTSNGLALPGRAGLRVLALEALGLAAVFALVPELIAAHVGLAPEAQPGWIAVLVLASRYGSGGLLAGLVASAAGVAIGSVVSGVRLATAWGRLDSGANLVAFAACLAVSWVASWHVQRLADLRERLWAASRRAEEAEAATGTLRQAVTSLRVRVDRASNSLSFLRDVAGRLDGPDPVAAAEGAVDLALARTDASAAAVRIGSGAFERTLAVRDARVPRTLAALTLQSADLTVPIRSGGERIGIIALWGVRRAALDEATTRDLEVIASWCVRALTMGAWQ